MIPQIIVAQIIDNIGGIQNLTLELIVLAVPTSITDSKENIFSLIAELDKNSYESVCQLCLVTNAFSNIETSFFEDIDMLLIEKLNFHLE